MDNQDKNSISDKIISKIKSGEIKMKPKIYFIFRAVLLVLGVLCLSLFAIYIVSFIFFYFRASGMLFLPQFGFSGVGAFLGAVPWVLILISLILVVTLEIFAKHFNFVWRQPIVYSLLVIVLIVSLGAFIVGRTPLHPNLLKGAQENRLPVLGQFYRDYGMAPPNHLKYGIIVEKSENSFKIKTPSGKIFIIDNDLQDKLLLEDIEVGDVLMIMGKKGMHKVHKDPVFFNEIKCKANCINR